MLPGVFSGSNEKALEDSYEIEMPLLILRLLDRNQSFDASPLVLDDSVDESERVFG